MLVASSFCCSKRQSTSSILPLQFTKWVASAVVLMMRAPPGGGVTRIFFTKMSALRWAMTPMPPQWCSVMSVRWMPVLSVMTMPGTSRPFGLKTRTSPTEAEMSGILMRTRLGPIFGGNPLAHLVAVLGHEGGFAFDRIEGEQAAVGVEDFAAGHGGGGAGGLLAVGEDQHAVADLVGEFIRNLQIDVVGRDGEDFPSEWNGRLKSTVKFLRVMPFELSIRNGTV
jgi:hypothetical protein